MMVLAVVLVVLVGGTVLAFKGVLSVIGEVPKDRLGADPWNATLGVERVDPFQIVHVPDCAAGSVTRIVLWDANSKPYWEVAGPPSPMTSFVVGGTPKGFTVVVPYRQPARGAIVRLVAFRRAGEPVGLRYRAVDLVTGRVVALPSLSRFSREGFQTAEVCGDDSSVVPAGTSGGS